MFIDQRDIDGELVVAIHELPGAVQGIHQPVATSSRSVPRNPAPPTLRRKAGSQGSVRQARGDDPMGSEVGLGQRRFVGLGFDVEVGVIHVHDRRTRAFNQGNDPSVIRSVQSWHCSLPFPFTRACFHRARQLLIPKADPYADAAAPDTERRWRSLRGIHRVL